MLYRFEFWKGSDTVQNNNEFLATQPVGKLLFKLSIPAITAQIINLLYNLVDRVFIGHIENEGALALTGVGVCMPVIMIVSAFAALISMGSAPRASIEMGRGDNAKAEKILGNSFMLQIIISIFLTAVLMLFNRPLLLAFGASENTIEYASAYMSVYAVGTIFVQLTLGMNSFITAQGFAKIGMLSVLIGAVCNIVLDPLFIYAFNMGVRGAALATIISQAVSMIWVLSFLTGRKTVIRIKKECMRLEKNIVLPGLALGLAPFIMQASESVVIVCFNSSLLRYGGDLAVGSMTILSSVMQLSMLPMQGLGQGAQPITSYNYGAGNVQRVKKTFRLLLTCTLCYSFGIWLLVMLFPQVFAMIFSSDTQLIEFTAKAMRIYCLIMGLFGAQTACQLTFTAIGNAKSSITVAVLRKFILLLPLIYIMPHIVSDQVTGVYLAEPIADFISVVFTVILFSFQFKKQMKAVENKKA